VVAAHRRLVHGKPSAHRARLGRTRDGAGAAAARRRDPTLGSGVAVHVARLRQPLP
jgi:hypothetical protein